MNSDKQLNKIKEHITKEISEIRKITQGIKGEFKKVIEILKKKIPWK
jgi:hypothetical protein